tara:strand:- start:55 stop:510 length:456 start_codon:yes stop_codon:yes gene_type:complete
MQTIVRKDTNISLYYYPDSKTITIGSDLTTVKDGSTTELIIADCNSSNVVLHTGVAENTTYWGWKYKHDGSAWSANADYKGRMYLPSDINDSVTTIPVVNTNAFQTSGTVQIGDEKITYTGVNGTDLTGCTRGAASTSAASHASDSSVTQI